VLTLELTLEPAVLLLELSGAYIRADVRARGASIRDEQCLH